MDSLRWVLNVPWRLYRDQTEADGDIPDEKAVEPTVHQGPVEAPPLVVVTTRKVPARAFQIRNEDAERHGYPSGCAGRSSWLRGLGKQLRTPECRARYSEAVKDDAKFQNGERRRVGFEAKVKDKEGRKRRRRGEVAGVGGSDPWRRGGLRVGRGWPWT